MNVSRETIEQLLTYVDLLNNWSARINLVAPSTLPNAWSRHVEDSLQLLDLRPDPGPRWVDLGAGGGLPGLVVAIAAPSTAVTLIESDVRKATFLRRASAQLNLPNVTVLSQRIEAAAPQQASTVSARALAPLPKLMAYVERHLAPDGVALLLKGRSWSDEITDAQQSWSFDVTPHRSATQPDAAVLEIRAIHAR